MRCPECKAPVVTYDDTGEEACSEDASHEFDEAEDSPWFVNSDALAEWALAKLALAEQNIDRINDHAEDMIRRAEEFRANAGKRFVRDADFFRQHLAAYYEKVAPTLGKSKTYELVNGEITSRQGSEVVVIDDAEQVALDRPDLTRTKVEPDKTAIKKALKAGEIVPGAYLDRKPDEVKVRPAKAEHPAFLPHPQDESEVAA